MLNFGLLGGLWLAKIVNSHTNMRYIKIRLPTRCIPLWNKIICIELAVGDFIFSSPASGNRLQGRDQRSMTFIFCMKYDFRALLIQFLLWSSIFDNFIFDGYFIAWRMVSSRTIFDAYTNRNAQLIIRFERCLTFKKGVWLTVFKSCKCGIVYLYSKLLRNVLLHLCNSY